MVQEYCMESRNRRMIQGKYHSIGCSSDRNDWAPLEIEGVKKSSILVYFKMSRLGNS